MGALKAALMPAHTPADTNSRWSASLTISSSTCKQMHQRGEAAAVWQKQLFTPFSYDVNHSS
jgi:hypothetical protein